MARLARAEIFDPSEIVAVHLIGKTVRSCYLMGVDERSGKNFDHRKRWLEEKLKTLAANFGIDLLAFSCMSNHFHLLLRSRPDVVATWDAAPTFPYRFSIRIRQLPSRPLGIPTDFNPIGP